jgi:hypothetical protein
MMVVMQRLKELWLGRLPLDVAFWTYAIIYGLALNAVATGAVLVLIVLDAPIAIAIVVHLLPVPYSVLATRGVWRSADRYSGRQIISTVAKASVIVWFCFWLVA